MNTTDQHHCPKCGALVPQDAPQGLCPKCVLAGAASPADAPIPPTSTAEIPSLERVAAAFPQLEVLELIGRGGMGFVFKARQPHLDRFVALKLLPERLARDPQFTERFNREGRVLAKLHHPNIVSIFDFGRTEEFYFLIMEYVDGVNLRQAMQAGRFSPAEALSIVPKICEALQYAHEQGVLHRDIKPENILLDAKGRVKIADFGIAKLVGEEAAQATLTNTGAALGTPHYMAPEQLEKPSQVDQRADIYSLGVVFYEMLTGELPIGRFAPPSSKTPVSHALDEIVFRALERDREKRYQSAGQVKTEVEHAASSPANQAGAAAAESGVQEGIRDVPGGTFIFAASISKKAIWSALLTAFSMVVIGGSILLAIFAGALFGPWELLILGVPALLSGIAGTVLGWVALSEIRASRGRLGGAPFAVFAALSWPLLVLGGIGLGVPWSISIPSGGTGWLQYVGHALFLIVPASVITFMVWSILAALAWANGQPVGERSRVLKWVFAAVVVAGLGLLLASHAPLSRDTGDSSPGSPQPRLSSRRSGRTRSGACPRTASRES
jgi:tRNA A-37 threonylcarbamoyl transferase component Bud32